MDGIKVKIKQISGKAIHTGYTMKFDRQVTPSLHLIKNLAVCRYLGQCGPFIRFEFTTHGMFIGIKPDGNEVVTEFTIHLEDHNGEYTKV